MRSFTVKMILACLLASPLAQAATYSRLYLRGVVPVRGELSFLSPLGRLPAFEGDRSTPSNFIIRAHGMALIVETLNGRNRVARRTLRPGESLPRKNLGRARFQKVILSAP